MKRSILSAILSCCLLAACTSTTAPPLPLVGTWRLISATTITKGVSETTDYTKGSSMIKIINDDHFAFLKHDVNTPKDSSNHFDAGGGSYTLSGRQYTEHLDYYSLKNWEGKTFQFTVTISHDTLVQQGLEKVEAENIDRTIIEKYVRLASQPVR